ncbi:MAG: NAD(P)-dependent oxidoreductase [Candidatus Binatia bacterium]|nr:NAD(P)-dependent oxidoreductase [Candidatus Binatia bacterium]
MSFEPEDFDPVLAAYPGLEIVHHATPADLKAALPEMELVDTWGFSPRWYERAPKLRAVITPAAGRDWVADDPSGHVPVHPGTFHGPLIAESMLSFMLHFNRRVPQMLENERRREWDRNIQFPSALLRNQHAVIVGYGSIGRHCAKLLTAIGMTVAGCQRTHASGVDAESGARYCSPADLPQELARADHVVLLLPGGDATNGYLSRELLGSVKRGARVYNFGRGTTSLETDLLWALEEGILSGAGLDVTEVEPLPAESPLWEHPAVFVQPHSSCVYDEYRPLHVVELVERLRPYVE